MSTETHDGSPAADDTPSHRYTAALARRIETQWQDRWEAERTFEAPNPAGPLADAARLADRPKLFVLDMFPYPSGSGLHVGHPLGYIGTDVFGRFRRMKGYNVLHSIGYDAFGLPAEQYAIQTGTHPRVTTENNIANMRRQLRRLGLAHDQRRSISTTDEDYYRWTQWIFLQIFHAWYDHDANRARPIAELVTEF
ncbi:MAG: Leucine-tRNA ligase, partial [Actinomycetota bacterium]